MLTDQEQRGLETLRQSKDEVDELLKSKAWTTIVQVSENQVRLRRMELANLDVADLKDCFTQARLRGVVLGLGFLKAYFETVQQELKVEIQNLLDKEREKEDGTGLNTDGLGTGSGFDANAFFRS